MDGEQLFEIVRDYAAMGAHRTGTDVDLRTAAWTAQHLADRGLDVEPVPVPYQQWVASGEVELDGQPLEHLPVFHEWTGALETNNVYRAQTDAGHGGHANALTDAIAKAEAGGAEAAVLATEHVNGSLVAVNRVLGEHSGFPTILVAGRDGDRLMSATDVTVRYSAKLVDGHTTNVIATTRGARDSGQPPLMLTTPLTGWFGCAGERATGIAVLFALVERFADRDLLIVATGGHELTWFGAQRWVDELDPADRPSAIVHVGASVGVVDPGTSDLIATRLALTSLDDSAAEPVTDALVPIGLNLATGCERWIGEGESWSQAGVPLLSFSGAGVDFHTPEDTSERATTPDALSRAATAIGNAVQAFTAAL